jgi:hypothetical protein
VKLFGKQLDIRPRQGSKHMAGTRPATHAHLTISTHRIHESGTYIAWGYVREPVDYDL